MVLHLVVCSCRHSYAGLLHERRQRQRRTVCCYGWRMTSREPGWSRPALVMAIYLALAATGLVWSTMRGHPNVWRIEGRTDPQVVLGVLAGLLMGLGIVFASRLAVHRFEWARALHRDLRGLLGPLP